jgi:hypothetical protein
MAKVGVHQHALGLARSIDEPDGRVWALARVADALIEGGDRHQAAMVLREAECVARAMTEPACQIQALVSIAAIVAKNEDRQWACVVLQQTETIARTNTAGHTQAWALKMIAETAAQVGDNRWALTIARSIREPETQAQALRLLLTHTDSTERIRIVAQTLKLTPWHDSVRELVDASPPAARAAISELLTGDNAGSVETADM